MLRCQVSFLLSRHRRLLTVQQQQERTSREQFTWSIKSSAHRKFSQVQFNTASFPSSYTEVVSAGDRDKEEHPL